MAKWLAVPFIYKNFVSRHSFLTCNFTLHTLVHCFSHLALAHATSCAATRPLIVTSLSMHTARILWHSLPDMVSHQTSDEKGAMHKSESNEAKPGSQKSMQQAADRMYESSFFSPTIELLTFPHSQRDMSPLELKGIGSWADIKLEKPELHNAQQHHELPTSCCHEPSNDFLPIARWLAEDAKAQPWVGLESIGNIRGGNDLNGGSGF